MRIFHISRRFGHHAGPSGYDRVSAHVGARPLPEAVTGFFEKRIARMGESRREPWLDDIRSGWYLDSRALAREAAAAALMPVLPGIYHFLYGENDFRWSGRSPFRRKSRLVVTFHQPPEIFEKAVPDPRIAALADGIIVNSGNQKAYFENLTGRKNVHVVHHGVDTNFFTPGPEPFGPVFRVLTVGQWLRDHKTLSALMDRVEALSLPVRFGLVGSPEAVGAFCGRENVTVFPGISDEALRALYQKSDALLLPLTDATANNAIVEAMACGRPVLSTDVGGVSEYVAPGCGILAKPGDAEGLLDALVALMEDPEKKAAMGRAARERAVELDFYYMAGALSAVYRKILEER